ncbi:proline-rich protein 29-like isoform X2 [Lithobates pipiens]
MRSERQPSVLSSIITIPDFYYVPALAYRPQSIQQSLPWSPHHPSYDLVDLMMIQNAQMHQVIMNNMAMSALSSFGYGAAQPPPVPSVVPIQVEEEEEQIVYHHHYEAFPSNYSNYMTYPAYPPAPLPMPQREPTIRHLNMDMEPSSPRRNTDQRPVPPPPPLSATGTVGADVPPATEYYDLTEARK